MVLSAKWRYKQNKIAERIVFTMKKTTTLLTLIIILSALIGAVSAMFVYLKRREKELDEYEQILFDSDIIAQEAELAQVAE